MARSIPDASLPSRAGGGTSPPVANSHAVPEDPGFKTEKKKLGAKLEEIKSSFQHSTEGIRAGRSRSSGTGSSSKGGKKSSTEKAAAQSKKNPTEKRIKGWNTIYGTGTVLQHRDPRSNAVATKSSISSPWSRASRVGVRERGGPKASHFPLLRSLPEGKRGGVDRRLPRASSRDRGGGGGSSGAGLRRSPTRHGSSSPRSARKGREGGGGGKGKEEWGGVGLPVLLESRRSYKKALQNVIAASGGSGRNRGKHGEEEEEHRRARWSEDVGGTRHAQRRSDRTSPHNSRGSSGEDEVEVVGRWGEEMAYMTEVSSLPPLLPAPHTAAGSFSSAYVEELEARVRWDEQQLQDTRHALHDALGTVEQLRRENDALREIQQQLVGKGYHTLWQGIGQEKTVEDTQVAPPFTEMLGTVSTNASSTNKLQVKDTTPTATTPSTSLSSMELARLRAENALLEEQKRILRAEVDRLQQAQQQSWETSQQQLAAMSMQLQSMQLAAGKKEEHLHTRQSAWEQEKYQLERECQVLRLRCATAEAAAATYKTSGSAAPASSSSVSMPSTTAGGRAEHGAHLAILHDLQKQQEELTRVSVQQERQRWEEELKGVRQELQEAQKLVLKDTQEKYTLQRYTERVGQLEEELREKSKEVGAMEQQLLQALGALQSCQRDAAEAVRQETHQEIAQLRQELEAAHDTRREKEKMAWEAREQLAEANRKASQSAADVEMYKEVLEKYYAGVVQDVARGPAMRPVTHTGSAGRPWSGSAITGAGLDHLRPSSASPPLPFSFTSSPASHPTPGTTSGLTSDELHRAYAVAALQKSSKMASAFPWGSGSSGVSGTSKGDKSSDPASPSLPREAAAPLHLFEALHWDETWEAKQLREALATAALDLELAVQQAQQERTQAEHYRDQLEHMTKERDLLLEENMEMRRRLRHVQTVFAKQQMKAYREAVAQGPTRLGNVSPGWSYALGERGSEGGHGDGVGKGSSGESGMLSARGDRGKAALSMEGGTMMSFSSGGQIHILLRSVWLEDTILPLLGFDASPKYRSSPTSLFMTLDGLMGYSTMLSPTFYSVEEGLSDVLFQYDGLSPDHITVEVLQQTTLVIQLHRALRGTEGGALTVSGGLEERSGQGQRSVMAELQKGNLREGGVHQQQRPFPIARHEQRSSAEEEQEEEGEAVWIGIEGGSEIVAQGELPGTWLLQASEITQEATLELISGKGDVVGHVVLEFTCQRLMLPVTLGFPLSFGQLKERGTVTFPSCAAREESETVRKRNLGLPLGIEDGCTLSVAEVKAAIVALRSVLGIRVQVFRLEGIAAEAPPSSSSLLPSSADPHAAPQDSETSGAERVEKALGRGREVSPYVFYTTNSPFPTVSAIRDTVVRPSVVQRRNAEEATGSNTASSRGASPALLNAVFEASPTEHRVALDRDLIHFLYYSSIAFVVFDEQEEDISRKLGVLEFPLRPLLDSPQTVIREEAVLHPRGKLTVGLSWGTM